VAQFFCLFSLDELPCDTHELFIFILVSTIIRPYLIDRSINDRFKKMSRSIVFFYRFMLTIVTKVTMHELHILSTIPHQHFESMRIQAKSFLLNHWITNKYVPIRFRLPVKFVYGHQLTSYNICTWVSSSRSWHTTAE
jgi:hypothetical protein